MNRFCRYELRTTDVEAGRAFYRELFGAEFWSAGLDVVPLPPRAAAAGAPSNWVGHIGVDDVVGMMLRFLDCGAKPLGPMPQGSDATDAFLRDPFGAVVALSSNTSAPEVQRVAWHLLSARDEMQAFAVYSALFGWVALETHDLGMLGGRHVTFAWDRADRPVGSASDVARLPHVHPQWLFFFRTEHLGASLAQVRELGGLTQPPTQTATGDLVAACDDPQGAAFGLYEMARRITFAVVALFLMVSPGSAQVRQFPLESRTGLILHNVAAEPVTLQGKKGLRLTMSPQTINELNRLTPQERDQRRVEQLATIADLEFSNGVIEVELAGAPAPDAPAGARGFVGIAFRVQPDNETYDAFYLRPTNGRADDQERRNHATQYISHPAWTWSRLRKETPSKYESYVDLVTGVWTKIRIDVHGSIARLFVHDSPQPTLIVSDVKSGPQAKGAVALWLDIGTVAHFRNLTVRAN